MFEHSFIIDRMSNFKVFTSRIVPLLANDIDTDQIIPARFLKVIDKAGLGNNLFADWRYREDGSPVPDFVLNNPAHSGSQILLAGSNFGCGSSREHAPWALCGFGFRAVVSDSFADIFRNNALKNGLLPIEVNAASHRSLVELTRQHPEAEVSVDLQTQSLILPSGENITFPIDGFSKYCLLNGVDELGYLFSFERNIKEYELKNNSNGAWSKYD